MTIYTVATSVRPHLQLRGQSQFYTGFPFKPHLEAPDFLVI